jgi:hypothetical protein
MLQSKQRKLRARLWLCVILCVLTGAHYFFYRFSANQDNPYPLTRGLTFGLVLWTSALLLAMWLRLGWARYVIIALLAAGIAGYGLSVLMMTSQSVDPLPEPVHAALEGMLLYALALVPLGISPSLRYFLAPRTAGGR